MQNKIDPTVERLIKETADELGLLTTQVSELYSVTMELAMRNVRLLNAVLLPNMGKFFISPYKTERLIDRMFQSMNNRESGKNPDGMTREEVKERLQVYWPYHEKARKHYIRTGKRYKARKKREAELSLLGENSNIGELQAVHEGRES